MTPTHHPRRLRLIAATIPLVLLASCGDDDADRSTATDVAPTATTAADTAPAATDPAPTEAAASEEFCAVATQLAQQDGPPTPEQLAEYSSLAPAPIAEPTATVVAAFEAAGDDLQAVFGDPAVLAAIDELSAFEATACGLEPPSDPSVTQLDPDATRVDIAASDYMFDVALPTSPGRYSFVMQNTGQEPHLLILAHLEEGATMADVMASDGESGLIASFESNIAIPGGEAVVTADIEPGRWVIVCPIPNADGVSHAELGMIHEFTVG